MVRTWAGGNGPISAQYVWHPQDPVEGDQIEFGEKLGRSVRASRVLRFDCNHWTVLRKPAEVAAALEAYWSRPE
ncbi:hypothetical protein [Streptomyces shenzhenensis]|uniref:hypothetical protein n=1 Tax=Streptomyces shenzhenensis TaxID=943815 RepID=UPI0033E1866C